MHIAQRFCINMVTCILDDRLSAVNKLRYFLSMHTFDPTNQNFRIIQSAPQFFTPQFHSACLLSRAVDVQSECFQSDFEPSGDKC